MATVFDLVARFLYPSFLVIRSLTNAWLAAYRYEPANYHHGSFAMILDVLAVDARAAHSHLSLIHI